MLLLLLLRQCKYVSGVSEYVCVNGIWNRYIVERAILFLLPLLCHLIKRFSQCAEQEEKCNRYFNGNIHIVSENLIKNSNFPMKCRWCSQRLTSKWFVCHIASHLHTRSLTPILNCTEQSNDTHTLTPSSISTMLICSSSIFRFAPPDVHFALSPETNFRKKELVSKQINFIFIFYRYGPHFDDVHVAEKVANVSAQLGSVGFVDCRIRLLQDKTVNNALHTSIKQFNKLIAY